MQHIITDEEVNNAVRIYTSAPGIMGAMKKALTDFLTNRPESTLGKLRPIAEMPETVPEGCVRMFVYRHASGCFGGPFFIHSTGERFNFFADIQLPTPDPDPEAEERLRFEEAFKQVIHEPDLRRREDTYEDDETADFWALWKLAKAK